MFSTVKIEAVYCALNDCEISLRNETFSNHQTETTFKRIENKKKFFEERLNSEKIYYNIRRWKTREIMKKLEAEVLLNNRLIFTENLFKKLEEKIKRQAHLMEISSCRIHIIEKIIVGIEKCLGQKWDDDLKAQFSIKGLYFVLYFFFNIY